MALLQNVKMSRSASKMYIRFASTSSHASSKPPRPSSSPSFGSSYQPAPPIRRPSQPAEPFQPTQFPIPPPPPNETPQEKVARLRAASRLAKSRAAMTPLDRVIDTGRRVADTAHAIVAYGLIGFTIIATVITVYAITDLMRHNRRQKRAWVDRELQRLYDARKAFVRGDATPEQLHILEQERAGDEIVERARLEKERKRREGWWARGVAAVEGLVGKEKREEGKGGEEGGPGGLESTDGRGGGEVLQAESFLLQGGWVEEGKRDGRDMVEDRGGVGGEKQVKGSAGLGAGTLDVMAANIAGAVTEKTVLGTGMGWFGWGGGKDQS